MNKYSYTYLPVLDNREVVKGIICSDAIIHIINHRRDYKFDFDDPVSKYMKLFSLEENGKNYYIFIPKDIFVYELKEQVEKYLNNGAQPSTRVIRILTKEGIKMPKWVKTPLEKHSTAKHADKLRKNQPKEEVAPAEEAPAEA
jgi:hypothetical protein